MKAFKESIGTTSTPRVFKLEPSTFKEFADCVHATVGNTSFAPLSSVAVPTIFTRFREGEFELLERMGIALPQVLHAEQTYEMLEVLHPAEEVSFKTSLASVFEKKGKGSNMAFLVFETEFIRTLDSQTIARAKSTMVYREGVS